MSHLEPIIAPVVEAAGYRLVRLRLIGTKRKTLQVMAERADGLMDVEDCARLSRALSEFLDAEDPIEGEYVLEVSSPGIDRPLTRITDFARWAGHEAKLELNAPDETGRRRFKGLLLGLDGNDVVLDVGGHAHEVRLPQYRRSQARAHRQTDRGRFEGAQNAATVGEN